MLFFWVPAKHISSRQKKNLEHIILPRAGSKWGHLADLESAIDSPTGGYRFSRFNVLQILSWEDIVDKDNRVLVTEFDSSDPRHMHVVEYWR